MLYLATFGLQRTSYMQDKSPPAVPKIRLIRANHIIEAEDMLRDEVERNDPYGTGYSVVDLEITACIQNET
jgi:hypothetical protein